MGCGSRVLSLRGLGFRRVEVSGFKFGHGLAFGLWTFFLDLNKSNGAFVYKLPSSVKWGLKNKNEWGLVRLYLRPQQAREIKWLNFQLTTNLQKS